MLAISNKLYYLPEKSRDSEVWFITRRDSEDYIGSSNFNYTIEGWSDDLDPDSYVKYGEIVYLKMTFTYNANSVKPTPRTLRVYGADALAPVVSFLSTNRDNHYQVILAKKLDKLVLNEMANR